MSDDTAEETTPKMVSQDVLRERINAKNKEIQMLKSSLETSMSKAQNYDAISGERDTLKNELTSLRDTTERFRSLNGLGIAEDKHDGFKAIFDSEMASRQEGERKGFGDWLSNGAKDHPLLNPHFTKAPAEAEKSGKPTGPIKTPEIVRMDAHVQPPAPQQGKMTPAQMASYFRSPEYKILSAEDQKAKRNQMMLGVANG